MLTILPFGYSFEKLFSAIFINEDRDLARESILKVADFPFEQAVFGHGNPLKKRANQLLKERFIDTKLK